ncbi:MAG: LPS-assembly protein LptD, partial [Desulfobacterales bacterium]|nr:LPS-assembly protein LptD [Desulfobacterales bacterium]
QGLFGFQARPDLEEEWGRPVEEKRSPTRRSGLRLSHDSEDNSLQALFEYHQQQGDPAGEYPDQPIMGLNFISLPEQLKNFPVFFGLGSEYGFIWRDDEDENFGEKLGKSGHRFSLSPELKFPFWLFDYLEFEPSLRYIFNARLINYPDNSDYPDEVRGTRENQYKKIYEAGLRMSASAERFFDFKEKTLKKLRHKISPVLSYTYRVDQDEENNSPWFEPTDRQREGNLLTLSMENFLDARLGSEDGIFTYRQWATLDIIQSYDISEARRDRDPEKGPFEPLTATLSVTPFPVFDLTGSASWDHYDNEFSNTSLSLDLTVDRLGGKVDTYAVDYIYSNNTQESLDFEFDINISRGFSVGCSVERDMDLKKTISGQYWLGYRSQCWGLKAGLEDDEDTSVIVIVDLMGLGEFSQ